MKTYGIVEVRNQRIPRHIQEFMHAVADMELYFTAASLKGIYRSEREIELAIGRAMSVCKTIGLPLELHFRRRYISDSVHHTMEQDWRLSKVAYCLTLVNGDPENPMVGKIQWELLKRMM